MTHPTTTPTAPANGSSSTTAVAAATPKVGPHPGFISSSNQYSSEARIRRMFRNNGCDPAREDNYRLQGVQLIENVREHLKLYAPLHLPLPPSSPPSISPPRAASFNH